MRRIQITNIERDKRGVYMVTCLDCLTSELVVKAPLSHVLRGHKTGDFEVINIDTLKQVFKVVTNNNAA